MSMSATQVRSGKQLARRDAARVQRACAFVVGMLSSQFGAFAQRSRWPLGRRCDAARRVRPLRKPTLPARALSGTLVARDARTQVAAGRSCSFACGSARLSAAAPRRAAHAVAAPLRAMAEGDAAKPAAPALPYPKARRPGNPSQTLFAAGRTRARGACRRRTRVCRTHAGRAHAAPPPCVALRRRSARFRPVLPSLIPLCVSPFLLCAFATSPLLAGRAQMSELRALSDALIVAVRTAA